MPPASSRTKWSARRTSARTDRGPTVGRRKSGNTSRDARGARQDGSADDRRPKIDRPTNEGPPVRFQSRLAGGDRSPLIPIVALVVLVGIAALSSGPAAPGGTAV